MLSYEEALQRLLQSAQPLKETVMAPLAAASGRILAQAQHASLDVPPHDNSAMDGYAVNSTSLTASGVRLPVSQRIPAGTPGQALKPGSAARIFTGAPLPAGADAVVMQELCEAVDDAVIINHQPQPGENIRRAAEDIARGAEILPAGKRLGAAEIGLLASIGLAELPLVRKYRVALLSTGDELTEPGQPLSAGGIYNSNRYFLRVLLEGMGCEVSDLGRVRDELQATRDAIRQAADAHDLILSTGGVSVGEEDHVKAAIEAEGALELWKIAIKPGKPLAFGRIGEHGAAFIGLPGNPVSSFVTFLLMVRPFILKSMGAHDWQTPHRNVIAASDWLQPDKRREFLRARINAQGEAHLFGNQGSAVLTSCAWAEGFIDNPPGQAFRVGDTVSFISLRDLF